MFVLLMLKKISNAVSGLEKNFVLSLRKMLNYFKKQKRNFRAVRELSERNLMKTLNPNPRAG